MEAGKEYMRTIYKYPLEIKEKQIIKVKGTNGK